MYAQLLTPMQVMMLREAAAMPKTERNKAIEETTTLIKKQSPEKFFHYTKEGKPDPAMKQRMFYDEPRHLELADYAECTVPYAGADQMKMFRARGK